MSGDGLEIGHGGMVAVDTESLRAARRTALRVAERTGGVAHRVKDAARVVGRTGESWLMHGVSQDVHAASDATARLAESATALATALSRAADLYELVELRLQWAASEGDPHARAAIEARVQALGAGGLWGFDVHSPAWLTFAALDARTAAWRVDASADLRTQAWLGSWLLAPLGPGTGWGLALAGQLLVDAAGRHTVRSGTAPGGPVRGAVTTLLSTNEGRVPTSLAALARRVPGGDEARVVVERYDMPDGEREWVVYIAGSQGLDADEPFNLQENLPLYAGQTSASYEAVLAAMDQAGVRSGEAVHAVGHSQGAMIAANLAASGAASVQTLVTFGSPVVADLPPSTLVVDVRHTDDPVAALAGPGLAAGTGSSDSIVVQRLADPLPGLHDVTLPAHRMESYVETARRVDASQDPRVDSVRGLLERLGGASAVVVTQYAAERVTAPGPVPQPSAQAKPTPPAAR